MPLAKITLQMPAGLEFSDLNLARDPDGTITFEWGPIDRLCAANEIDPALMRDEDNRAGLIVAWYMAHLAHGGARDPVQDDLLAEIKAEDARGGGLSYPHGRA